MSSSNSKIYEEFLKEIHSFIVAGKENGSLLSVIANHYFDMTARKNIVTEVCQKMGLKQEILNFLKLLITKGRAEIIEEIASEYEVLVNQKLGRQEMTIVSAVELDAGQYDELEQIMKQKTGKDVMIRKVINKDVLGGVRIHVGDDVYDYTVSHQIEKMKVQLLSH